MEIKQVTPSLVQFTRDKDRWYFDLPKGLEMDPDSGEFYLAEDVVTDDPSETIVELIDQIEAYPSTTWICGYVGMDNGPLLQWAAKHGSYEEAIASRDAAGERGQRVHAAMEHLIKPGSIKLDDFGHPDEWHLVQAGVNVLNRLKPQVIALEYNFTHETENIRYGGTIDLKCRVDVARLLPITGRKSELPEIEEAGETLTVILDWKTSSGIYASHRAQLGAYAVADADHGPFDKAFLAHLGARNSTWSGMNGPGFQLHEVDVAGGFSLFKAAHVCWQDANNRPRPRIESFPQELTVEL